MDHGLLMSMRTAHPFLRHNAIHEINNNQGRHSQCDLHTTTDVVLNEELNAKCTVPFASGIEPKCCKRFDISYLLL
eukprot:scaffold32514_cov57-Cyclotella_meneghiniana.AAC.7